MLSMGKSTISMGIFNSYVSLPEGMYIYIVIYVRILRLCQTWPENSGANPAMAMMTPEGTPHEISHY